VTNNRCAARNETGLSAFDQMNLQLRKNAMSPSTRSRLAIGGVPLHAMLAPFPVACFTGALLTDIAYANTAVMQWSNFSAWLLAFGVLVGVIDGLLGLIDWSLMKPRPAAALWHFLGYAVVLLLALVNSFVHARDGWTSVVPTGLILSAVTVAIMVVSGFIGHRMTYAQVRGVRT
jgi:uncharacterized membrane protein